MDIKEIHKTYTFSGRAIQIPTSKLNFQSISVLPFVIFDTLSGGQDFVLELFKSKSLILY